MTKQADASLTGQLIELIRAKPITDQDLKNASLFVLDTMACALAGRYTPQAMALKQFLAHRGDAPAMQAFLFGGLAHIVEMDDLHRGSVTHPGCVVVPPALAMALDTRASGQAFLTAVLHGYEACCRVGAGVGPAHYKIWHNTATCGPFGSAMASASLLALDQEASVWALGNAGTQSAGLWQFLPDGAMSKHLHTARACEAGMTAADLAAHGFTGPAHILEGAQGLFAGACPDAEPEAVVRDPAAPWALVETSMKPYPCCRHTHPAIDCALEILEQAGGHPLALDQIQRVELATYAAALNVCNRPEPDSEYQAKFSLQHTLLETLSQGEIGFDSFNDEARARQKGASACVSLREGAGFEAAYPGAWGNALTVTLGDGRCLTAETTQALGDPGKPLGEAAVVAKARKLLALGEVDPSQGEALIAACLSLPEDGSRLPRIHKLLMEGAEHEH